MTRFTFQSNRSPVHLFDHLPERSDLLDSRRRIPNPSLLFDESGGFGVSMAVSCLGVASVTSATLGKSNRTWAAEITLVS